EAAIESDIFTDIVVSTDSEEYASISKRYGASIPFLRPDELASDIASSADMIVYTIQRLKELGKVYDYFVLLQPTSPLRKASDIKNAVDLLIENKLDSVVSVCEAEHSLSIYNTLGDSLSLEGFINKNSATRRQDDKKYYRINGSIYISNVKKYLSERDFYGKKSKAYIMSRESSIDIDTGLDFKIAEYIMTQDL
ncbi:MAG TPA: CMP-N-acetlyneuraminic acid synthetase, partial [Clostridium sp.]|nr:CMP-N-acetlyneuraminic acid synthetase [Clostridium sp.]